MSDLDKKGLEAAGHSVTALVESGQDYSDSDLAVTAIRAYEAHKASAVPDDEVEKVARHIFAANPPSQDDDWDLIPDEWRDNWRRYARAAIAAMRPSAVPDEVREVIHWLRYGDSENASEWERRAADLLEQLALGHKVQEKHRDAFKQLADENERLKEELKHCEEMHENAIAYPNDAAT